MKVAYLLTAHLPTDERIWYHQKPALEMMGYEVFILSSRFADAENDHLFYFPNLKNKWKMISQTSQLLTKIDPEIIICDTPLAFFYADLFKRRTQRNISLIYDVTEFYPSKKNIKNSPPPFRLLKKKILLNLFRNACRKVDGFIFGEESKSLEPLSISQSKTFVFSSYYPDMNFIRQYPIRENRDSFSLFYAGNTTDDKGFYHIIEVAKLCASLRPEIQFELNIISYTLDSKQISLPDNLKLNDLPYLPFPQFCDEAGKYDLYLDLRIMDDENMKCLPIKLFYYMAFGKPVLFSSLTSIKNAVPEINTVGYLVDPDEYRKSAELILHLIDDPDLYQTFCENARRLADSKYNWESIKSDFICFIQQFQRHEPD